MKKMKRFLLILLAAALSSLAILAIGLTGFALAEGVADTIQPDSYEAMTSWEEYIFLGAFLMFIPTGAYALIVSITLSFSRWLRSSRLRAWVFSILLTGCFIAGITLWALAPWKNGFSDLHYGLLPLSWNLIMVLSGLVGTEVALLITRRSRLATELPAAPGSSPQPAPTTDGRI